MRMMPLSCVQLQLRSDIAFDRYQLHRLIAIVRNHHESRRHILSWHRRTHITVVHNDSGLQGGTCKYKRGQHGGSLQQVHGFHHH